MQRLTLDTFIASAGCDYEKSQYTVLNSLRSYRTEFSHNILYPSLKELIDLSTALEQLIEQRNFFQGNLPHDVLGIDLEHQEILYAMFPSDNPDVERVMDLIVWALPQLRKVIEEGTGIYDFVDENISVTSVGVIPMYKQEGYCIVPDHKASLLHFLQYQVSLYSAGDENYRTLKTKVVESFPQLSVHQSPIALKQEFISHHNELPNPATFMCETELDFPFQETILPVVKRKLISHVIDTVH